MKSFLVLIVVSLMLLATTGLAQTKKDAKEASSEPKELDFEGDVIETSFLKPDGSLIQGEKRTGGISLLRIRNDFVTEIVKSADDI
ncbi:MAG: hypothetical protein HUU55_00375 [Myxococcales bacterium]|nr:hypothetical protein [Myxococcales bacterium]